MRQVAIGLAGIVSLLSVFSLVNAVQNETPPAELNQANRLFQDQNYKEAANVYRELIGNDQTEGAAVAEAMQKLLLCQQQLGIFSEMDSDWQLALDAHPDEYRVWETAASQISNAVHFGVIADQKFTRGYQRGYAGRGGVAGSTVNVVEQDRIQALQWRLKAIDLASDLPEDSTEIVARLHLELTQSLLMNRNGQFAWALQSLTALSEKPEYTDLSGPAGLAARHAPVDDEGNPIFYHVPTNWEQCQNDGQRLRWALEQAGQSPVHKSTARMAWADFLSSQFAVSTLQQDMWLFRAKQSTDEGDLNQGVFSIHTLAENETLARLAAGIKRFTLPEDFNHIAIYRELMNADAELGEAAASRLVQVFLNRRQYPKAATILEQSIAKFGDDGRASKKQQLENILQPRVVFDPTKNQLAGKKARLSLLFRNARELSFSARKVDVEKILLDTKQFYRQAASQQPNQNGQFGGKRGRQPPQLSSPSSLFDAEDLAEDYLQGDAIEWNETVEPRAAHWDRRIEVETPLSEAGLYVVDVLAGDGSSRSRCLIWLQDLIVVRKQLQNESMYHLADAESGKPIAGANIELFGFGWQQRELPRGRGQSFITTENLALRTDAQGMARVKLRDNYQWYTVARSGDGRLALLDFEGVWYQNNPGLSDYRQLKAYGVSDRPLYRPGEAVKTQFWIANATYGDELEPPVANQPITVTVTDPHGVQVAQKKLKTDRFGSCDWEWELESSTPLGTYNFQVTVGRFLGGDQHALTSLSVRVEEYRKPEYEVTILSPEKPVALGETINARIHAKYFFGAPVTDAEVTVKVERSTYADDYYPIAPFDWCFGPGYWWFAEDYTWYPGWKQWRGCIAPAPPWFPRWRIESPELILEQQLELDATGMAEVAIDTALAKEVFGDENHKYTISVDVRDSSRRTVSAQGSVIAARDAFKVYAWTDRGHYRVGDKITAEFHARMLDGTPVIGNGTIDLLRIEYNSDYQPREQIVASQPAETNEEGRVTRVFSADQAGQYRVRLRLTDSAGHTIEGAYIFVVRGAGADGGDFHYGELELIPDKQGYAPGESVRLHVAANRDDALVALFVRPGHGSAPLPRWIQLEDKATVVEIPVERSDQPNFFVEAYTIYDGEVYREVREIIVPPAERVLDVVLKSNKTEYLPGEEAEIELTVTDPNGQPVKGSCAVAVYDRALEQLAGDVLPQDIREFFWKWRREYYGELQTSADTVHYLIHIPNVPTLSPLGIFGQSLADDADAMENQNFQANRRNAGALRSDGAMPAPMMLGRGLAGGAMPEAAMAKGAFMADAAESDGVAAGAAPTPNGNNSPAVRKDFADSALWLAKVVTDNEGKATAKFKMPENLTGWRLKSWAVGPQTQVGSASSEAVTRKPLLVRLQTPRFLVERDEVVISAIVHNDLPATRSVRVALEIDGETQFELDSSSLREQVLDIESHQQMRVDWKCRALAAGTIKLRAIAVTDDASDAMQLELPIVVNGFLKTDSWAGTVRDGSSASTVKLEIPDQRRVDQSKLVVRLSPSLASAMIDALPYMAEYPYGCTEQTLNRFLPTVITQRVLQDMNIDLARLKDNRRNNLNAQELGNPQERSEQWKRFDREGVYDEELVADMVKTGIQRLTDMQNADGGWGWFSGVQEVSGPHTTATVVRGLLVAQENEVPMVPDVLERGVAWLEKYLEAELAKIGNTAQDLRPSKPHPDNLDALVFHVLVLAGREHPRMQQLLYDERDHLTVYSQTMLAWATHRLGNDEQTAMLRRNIEQFLTEEPENETAFLRSPAEWWFWYGSEIEANAMYLKLLSALDPKSVTASRVVKFLLNNRKHATYWSSTRDTALVVEAFADYIAATGETSNHVNTEVWISGKRIGSIQFTPENLFDVDNSIVLQGSAIPSGTQQLEIRRTGGGNIYWNVYSTNFTLEEEIEPAGLEVKIERRYYRLESASAELILPGERANVVEAQRASRTRILLEDLDDLPSGEIVEVELLIQSKNDYEYLLIEDFKPASLESIETQSGYMFQAGLSVYRELRDRHIGLCIRWLPKGNYSLRYQLRSETPGTFTALPAVIQGMYAPELRGNSADFDLSVVD